MRDLNGRKRREQRSRLLNLRSLRCLLFKVSFSLFGSLSLRSSALTFATFALKPVHRQFLRCAFNAEDAEVLAKERRGGSRQHEQIRTPAAFAQEILFKLRCFHQLHYEERKAAEP